MTEASSSIPAIFEREFPWCTFGRRESSQEMAFKWRSQRDASRYLDHFPVGLLMAVSQSVDLGALQESLESVVSQSLGSWVCVVFDFASDDKVSKLVKGFNDNRLRYLSVSDAEVELEKEFHSCQRVGTLEPGSLLSPVALYMLAVETKQTDADVVYSHEVFLTPSGKDVEGYLTRPKASRFDLLHGNCIGKFWIASREVVRGHLWELMKGRRQEHGLFLGWLKEGWSFQLVPQFLYYSPADRIAELGAGPQELQHTQDFLESQEVGADVELESGYLRVLPQLTEPEEHLVSVVICFRDQPEWTVECLKKVEAQRSPVPIEVLLVNNGSSDDSLEVVRRYLKGMRVPTSVLEFPGDFHFARMNNWAIREKARGDLVMFLNNDVFLSDEKTISSMASWALQSDIGTVGIRLVYPHGEIQHDGIRAIYGDSARMARVGHFAVNDILSRQSRTVFGVSFAAAMVKRETFESLGGLSEMEFINGFGDIAFNLNCLELGLNNIYLGQFEGVHVESGSRGAQYEYWEECLLERRYPQYIQRMLREDWGWNRVPATRKVLTEALSHAVRMQVRERAPWLEPIKPHVKKWLVDLRRDKKRESST